MQHLFVYGTLRPGYPNEHVMTRIGGTWREASIKGRYVEKGWGFVSHGLPALIVDPQGQDIHGYVFSSNNLQEYWVELDRFEGREYRRVGTNATCRDGTVLAVQVYAYREDTPT